MNTDMQVLLAKTVFTGRVPTHTSDIPGTTLYRHAKPGGLIETKLAVGKHLLTVASVSSTLRKEFQIYLKTQMGAIAEMTWDSAIEQGLCMCHLEQYPNKPFFCTQAWLPDFTVLEWHLQLDRNLHAVLEFTRERICAQHVLCVKYSVHKYYPVYFKNGEHRSKEYTRRLPESCWSNAKDAASLAEMDRWDKQQHQAIRLWVREQEEDLGH